MNEDRAAVRERARRLLAGALEALRRAGVSDPELDAELLLAEAAGVERRVLLTGSFELTQAAIAGFEEFVRRRAAREPLAYIVGHKEFYGLRFEVNRAVLIPRPETEVLVDAALELLRLRPEAAVLDLGTGSGAIAAAVAVNAIGARIIATDISAPALEVARGNARRHHCDARIDFKQGDGFAPLACSHAKFDLILCNPPYVRDDEIARLEPEVARFEPRAALAGGKDGLDFYRRIAAQGASYLAPGGGVIVEIGAGQAAEVVSIFAAEDWRAAKVLRDLSGHRRVVHLRRFS